MKLFLHHVSSSKQTPFINHIQLKMLYPLLFIRLSRLAFQRHLFVICQETKTYSVQTYPIGATLLSFYFMQQPLTLLLCDDHAKIYHSYIKCMNTKFCEWSILSLHEPLLKLNHSPTCRISSSINTLTCIKHYQVKLTMPSYNSNLTTLTFMHTHVLPNSFILTMPFM